jgi:hypothetical protein
MFGPLVLNGIGRQVNSTNIVTVHNGGSTKGAMELMKELVQPTRLRNSIGDNAILGLSTRSRDSMLTLRRPGDQIVTQEHAVARRRATSVGTTSPISIRVDCQVIRRGPVEMKTQVQGPLYIAQDALHGSEMWFLWIMHMKTYLLDGIGNVRTSEGEILKSTNYTAELGRISHRNTICRQLGLSINWDAARFARTHTGTVQNIQHVLLLSKKETISSTLIGQAQEMMKRTHICHREFLLQSCNNPLKELR